MALILSRADNEKIYPLKDSIQCKHLCTIAIPTSCLYCLNSADNREMKVS